MAIPILETGVRPGEAANLQWSDVYLQPAMHAELGYIATRKGKSKDAKRNLSLTARAAEMLKARKAAVKSPWVFPGDSSDAPILLNVRDFLGAEEIPKRAAPWGDAHQHLTGDAGACQRVAEPRERGQILLAAGPKLDQIHDCRMHGFRGLGAMVTADRSNQMRREIPAVQDLRPDVAVIVLEQEALDIR